MEEVKKYIVLAKNLEKCSSVNRYDTGEEKEAWTLAHALTDLEQSFKTYSEVLLPKLSKQNLTEEETTDILNEIGEEFRHILYHISDPYYYSFLFPVEARKEQSVDSIQARH